MLLLLAACVPDSDVALDDGPAPADTDAEPSAPTETVTDGSSTTDSGATEAADLAAWTVMVFMNGDNDLEEWALADLNELEEVGSTDEVRFVVQLDRSTGFSSRDGNWNGARRYLAVADEDPKVISSPVLEDLGTVDSGDPQTIIDFVNWSTARYPAERYALVLWDHGDNWYVAPQAASSKGISYDYGSGNDLSVAHGDYEAVLEGVSAVLGRPLDLLGSDACTMSSWEILHVVQPHAEVYVGSQDYEDVEGWPYDSIAADLVADPDMEPGALGEVVAQRFHEVPDSTMAAIDLAAVPALDLAVEALGRALLDGGFDPDLFATAASGAQGFDGSWSVDHDFLDLVDRLDAVAGDEELAEVLDGARAAAAGVVLANYTMGGRVSGAQGFSIYSPANRVSGLYFEGSWCEDSAWCELLDSF